ncbi:MAG: YdeI/OmpD-associated family protein [Candidatus Kapabacteria bacterium]|jgi:uncharacterized protein YdeI (YjbR/CyaY-like superfamily)|nr:YdeI/OmpD-associated family protein [Candidatus Kapabacteria bacterium]
MAGKLDSAKRIEPLTPDELRQWFVDHCEQSDGVWVVRQKASTGRTTVTMEHIIEECLCFGWIDSLPRKLDEARTMVYIAPRKKGSAWSEINRAIIARLLEQGRMHRRGVAVLRSAQEDGSWDRLVAIAGEALPADVDAALEARPPAKENFQAFPKSSRRATLEWIVQARTETTRQRRIQEVVEAACQNKRLR